LRKVKVGLKKIFESREIKELRAKVELEPQDPAAHFNLGAAYERAGWVDEAIHEFEETLKGNPASAESHYNLAILYESVKNGEKAIYNILKAGTLFGNKNDAVNKAESRRLSREYYRKFNLQPQESNDL